MKKQKIKSKHTTACALALYSLGVAVALGGASAQTWTPDEPPLAALSADRFKTAQEAIRQQRYTEAILLLEPYVSEPERYPLHISDYIVALHRSGQSRQALTSFEKLPSAFPRRIYLLKEMGKAYRDTKQYEKSIIIYKEILERYPDNIDTIQEIFSTFLEMNQPGDASNLLEKYQLSRKKYLKLQEYYAISLIKQDKYREGLQIYDDLFEKYPEKTEEYTAQRNKILRDLPEENQQEAIQDIQISFNNKEKNGEDHLILLTVLFNGEKEAADVMEKYKIKPEKLSKYLANNLAWYYFSQNEIDKSLSLYKNILDRYPDSFDAQIGNIYALSKNKQYAQAHKSLQILEQKYNANLKVLYAKAYLLEQQGDFIEAIQVYDHMLTLSPGNEVVNRLSIRAYSDLGTPLHALNLAEKHFPEDKKLQHSLLADYALHTVAWEEPEQALALYNSILASPNAEDRYVFDAIMALAGTQRHDQAIAQYESFLARSNRPAPPWVQESVAGSYLYMRQPEKALTLYESAHKANPKSEIAIRGRIDTLTELRRWKEGEALLEELDKHIPDHTWIGKKREYNIIQQDLDIERGWMLMYQDRLPEAESYLQQLHEKAPANLAIRNARAHLYHWRGWPRLAEEEFNIISAMNPDYSSIHPGRLTVANQLGDKKQAREGAALLYRENPRDKHVQQLMRRLAVEEMHTNTLETRYTAEDDGGRDWIVRDEASTPLSLHTRLHAFCFLRRSWDNDSDAAASANGEDKALYFKRTGLGLSHMFNRDWRLRQQLSLDYENADKFGSLTAIDWAPDDHWQFSGTFDSFSTDIAHRARMSGVTAKKGTAGVRYRESEWREYNINVSRQLFSDDNERDEINLGYEQNLWSKNDWRMRVFVDLYSMWNSEWDNPSIWYYNPKNTRAMSMTHMTEQTVWNAYEQYFAHRLYLTLGVQKQKGYAEELIDSIKYEQEFTFSDTHSLSWNIWYGENVYDGDKVGNFGLNMTWSIRF